MSLTTQMARHFREVHFGDNWTDSSLKHQLANVTWQQAIQKVDSLNTIASLVYHINYYVDYVLKVYHGRPIAAGDSNSFALTPIHSQQDWEKLLDKLWSDAERFTEMVEQMQDSKLWENLTGEESGSYYRNIQGIIEHTHYHLGQIVILKKIISKT